MKNKIPGNSFLKKGKVYGLYVLALVLLLSFGALRYGHVRQAKVTDAVSTKEITIPFTTQHKQVQRPIDLSKYKNTYSAPASLHFDLVKVPVAFGDVKITSITPQGFIYDDAIAITFDKDVFAVGAENSTEKYITVPGLEGEERHQNGDTLKYVVSSNMEFGKLYKALVHYNGQKLTIPFMKPLLIYSYPINDEKKKKHSFIVSVRAREGTTLEQTEKLLKKYLYIQVVYAGKHVDVAVNVHYDKWNSFIIEADQDFPYMLKQTLYSSAGGLVQSVDHDQVKIETDGITAPFELQRIVTDARVNSSVQFVFSEVVNSKVLAENLIVSPNPHKLMNSEVVTENESRQAYAVSSKTLEFSTNGFVPGVTYNFKLDPALENMYGEQLGSAILFSLVLRPASPIFEMTGGINIVESAYPDYVLRSRNVKNAMCYIYKLSPQEVVQLVTKRGLDRNVNNHFRIGRFVTQNKIVGDLDNSVQYNRLHLPSAGFYFLRAETKEDKDLVPLVSFVNVTNIGLFAKRSLNTIMVWTTDLETGKPQGKVRIEVKDEKGHVLVAGTTDKDGIVNLTLKLKDPKQAKAPFFVFAHKKQDQALIVVHSDYGYFDSGIQPWEFDIYSNNDLASFMRNDNERWFLIVDSPIYKPGNVINYKIVAREYTADGLSYYRKKFSKDTYVKLYGPDWEELDKQPVAFNKNGSFVLGSFQLPKNAKTGQYSIRLVTPEDSWGRYLGDFQVADYRAPRTKFRIKPARSICFPQEIMQFDLRADYFFGQPMQNAPIAIKTSFDQTYDSYDEKYNDYTFYVYDWDNRFKSREDVAKVVTDLNGRSGYVQRLVNDTNLLAPLNVGYEFTLQDTLGINEKMTKFIPQKLYPARFKIGVKQDGFCAPTGTVSLFKCVAVSNVDGGQLERKISYTVYQDMVYTAREKGAGDSFEYLNKVIPRQMQSGVLHTKPDQPVPLEIKLVEPGHYYLEAVGVDEKGCRTTTRYSFYVSDGSYNWGRYNHERIDLEVDKKLYTVGEKVKVLIKSPFANAWGVLSVEGRAIKQSKIFQIKDNNAPVLELIAGKDFTPNAYVSVILTQGRIDKPIKIGDNGWTQIDLGKPAFKMGYKEIKVKDPLRDVVVSLSFDREKYNPGDMVKATVKCSNTNGKTRYAALVVNSALFELGSLPTNIAQAMHIELPLLTESFTNYNRIVGRRLFGKKGAIVGGDGGPSGKSKNRKDFRDIVAFLPDLGTLAGQGSFTFKLPEYSGEFKVLIYAESGADRFGYVDGVVLVRQDLLMENALPNFLRATDKVKSGIVLYSNFTKPTKFNLSGFVKLAKQTLMPIKASGVLDQKQEQFVSWTIPAQNEDSQLLYTAKVTAGRFTDGVDYTLPVYKHTRRLVTAINKLIVADTAHPAARETVLKLPTEGVVSGSSRAELEIHRSIEPLLAGPLTYLRDYPYSCWEQKLSKIVASAVIVRRGDAAFFDKQKAQRQLKELLGDYKKYKHDSGLLGYWPDSSAESYYLTAYTLEVFNFLQEQGFNEAARYRKELVKALLKDFDGFTTKDSYDGQFPKEYVLYQLMKAGEDVLDMIDTKPLPRYSNVEQVVYRYALLKRYKLFPDEQQTLRQKMRSFVTVGELGESYLRSSSTGWCYWLNSDVQLTVLAWQVLQDIPEENQLSLQMFKYLMTQKKYSDGWYTTHDNAVVLMNLVRANERYFKSGALKLNLEINGKQAIALDAGNGVYKQVLPWRYFSDQGLVKTKLSATTQAKQQAVAFYTLRIKQEVNQLHDSIQKSYTVKTEYFDLQGKAVASLVKGRNYKVRVSVFALDDAQFVAIDDQLPAALQPVDFELLSAQGSLQKALRVSEYVSYTDTRLDRLIFTCDHLPRGKHVFEYMTQAIATGDFFDPGAVVEVMYSPERQAIEKDSRLRCE